MDRINTASKAVDLFGAGKHGFKNRNVGLGIDPTDFNAEWPNGVQEELLSIIEAASIPPDIAVRTQVRQAIKRLFGGNVTTVNFAASPFALTADHAGLVLVDATAGNVVINRPAANVLAGLSYAFRRVDATVNTVTVNCAGADTDDGVAAAFVLAPRASRQIRADGVSKWPAVAGGFSDPSKQIQPVAAAVAANALTLTLNPTQLDFRSSPLSSGVVNQRAIPAAISCVVPSGATLGMIDGQASRLVLLALDVAGVVELAVVNMSGGNNLDETTLISTTALDASSDLANVIYSTVARVNVPFRVVGFVDSTQAVTGAWATAPSTVQGQGGQALAALQSIGYGQSWQVVTRVSGTTYYNTTGRPIFVQVNASGNVLGTVTIAINIAGVSFAVAQAYSNAGVVAPCTGTAIIPPGAAYTFTHTNVGAVQYEELR